MLRVNQVKVGCDHTAKEVKEKTAEMLRIPVSDILECRLIRQSIDARKKPEIFYSYSVDVSVKNEEKILHRFRKKENLVSKSISEEYHFVKPGTVKSKHRPVVVGMGPAGLFCAYYLAQAGYRPLLIERGKAVPERQRDVETFWETGILQPESNVQFGEGGAGTFSDGKLNTLVKDKSGRNLEVLKTFVKFGASPDIVYVAKPHIGTDVLARVVVAMRNEIIRLGGEVRFQTRLTDILTENGKVRGIVVNETEKIDCSQVVLAIGHSARDTFSMLYEKKLPMEAKAFAVGLRVEHPQDMINLLQYGKTDPGILGAAPYKLTAQTSGKRAVYTFCMCPGGYVVNASSEEGMTAVNGMSYSTRSGENANSAVIVSVTPDDFGSEHPLAGIEFQRALEKKAYELGQGKIPVQRFGEYRKKVTGKPVEPNCADEIVPNTKGAYHWTDLSGLLPPECSRAFVEGMEQFGSKLQGFDRPDAILLGVESRTSSPVRITRDETLQSVIEGLYPCGEGAGYAGGITSAAMDGIRVAEAIAGTFAPAGAQ